MLHLNTAEYSPTYEYDLDMPLLPVSLPSFHHKVFAVFPLYLFLIVHILLSSLCPLGGESEWGDRYAAKVSHSTAFDSSNGTGAGLLGNKSGTVFLDV